MPTYEYRCEACGHEFDEVQKITEPPVQRCPKCKKKKAHRLISQGNFILKGSGWYVTDYAGKGQGKKKSENAESKEPSESKSEPKGDKGDKGDKSDKKESSASKPDKKASAD
ncbi:MAG: zinc ribbon domain-containing protein [Deltaproteobacteria bacterium]|nr:zinc ribbon domain-containing protein [Deltaproteobacteria bacterium]